MMFSRKTILIAVLLAGWLTAVATAQSSERPERIERDPEAELLEKIQVVEHLGDKLPLDLAFTDSTGKAVKLGDYFDGERPVVIAMIYYRCPMLCGLVLNGMTEAFKNMKMTIGEEFQVVVVSFDPLETPELAAQNKRGYLAEYGRDTGTVAAGWHFLVGKEKNIKQLTETIGFGYAWEPTTKQYVHKASIQVITPDGVLSRYLYNVVFEPKTMRLSLVEASDGKIGTTIDQFILSCFHYDPATGTYAAQAMGIVRLGGFGTMILIGLVVGVWIVIGKKRRNRHVLSGTNPSSPGGGEVRGGE